MPISKLSFIRSTVLAILVGMTALLAIVAVNYWLVRQAAKSSEALAAARAERSAIVDLRNLLDDAETGQRGFLLTDDPRYLEPYLAAQKKIPEELSALVARSQLDPLQKEAVAKVQQVVAGKMAELARTVELTQARRRDEALALIKSDTGKDLMDQARALFSTMLQQAETRITGALRDQRDSIAALQLVTIVGALVIMLVVGGSAWTVALYTRQLITAQREVETLNANLEERVRERTADLGRANEEIQRFAYIVTHDLRAPLVNIMGFTSELEGCLTSIQNHVRGSDEASTEPAVQSARVAALEELPEAIGFIRSSTRKMDGLINAILKLSREGRRVLKPEPIGLDSLLKTAAASVQHQVAEAGGDIVIEGHVPPVISDRLALEQIFGNLLDNAVKYRAPDRPLAIRIRATEQPGHRLVVEVEDNGRGIDKQDHERVFDLFRRSGAQTQAGEGIGLAHVRAMIRTLGGEITLRSELAKGTTMKLNLPRDLRRVMAAQTGAA